jgi:DNA topoisomerase IB
MENLPITNETPSTVKGQKKPGTFPRTISYQMSRNPKNKHKKRITVIANSLITPSGARVPPRWADVWMTNDAKSPLQAIGRDSKGRRVYLYSAEHMGMASAAKFARLKAFSKVYLSLIKRVRRDMKHALRLKLSVLLRSGAPISILMAINYTLILSGKRVSGSTRFYTTNF